jgi:hypothetical protein
MRTLPKTFGELITERGVIVPAYKDTHVEFSKYAADNLESYPDAGTRAVLVGVSFSHDDVILVHVDYGVWRSRNLEIENQNKNYYDRAGVACLSATEAGHYRPQDTIYVMASDEIAKYMTVVPDEETAEHKKYTVVYRIFDTFNTAIDRIETDDLETVLKNYRNVIAVFRGWPESVRQ